jgi:hypothetical protein
MLVVARTTAALRGTGSALAAAFRTDGRVNASLPRFLDHRTGRIADAMSPFLDHRCRETALNAISAVAGGAGEAPR